LSVKVAGLLSTDERRCSALPPRPSPERLREVLCSRFSTARKYAAFFADNDSNFSVASSSNAFSSLSSFAEKSTFEKYAGFAGGGWE
jgi:hypothetical protein